MVPSPPPLPPPETVTAVGADGCKGGRWIAYLAGGGGATVPGVFADLPALLVACPRAARVMIDVPIGLCDGVRPVDLGAERVTSRWNPRAFLSPARCAVTAGDWAEADRLNRAATGSGLSRRAWAIVPRIRATDECLRSHPSARRAVREVHPEVCFRALAGRPPAAGEKTPAGLAERLAPPEPLVPGARALVDPALASWPRSVLAADDAVDALAALAVALAPDADLRALTGGTGPTPLDPHGPPMEMVYRSAAR